MVTENVNVRFRESGARVIKRRIDEIGNAANNATRGIFLMQRALFVIGGAGILRGLQSYADALTNVENRLRLTSTSTENLEAVQSKLFETARKSRTGFRATADVYNRIALSAKNLGAGQKQILDVTETLQKAAIISGASAREANAALVQLGQGIASDRLSGDELRSVLEQLPAVADILVDYLNQTNQFGKVTRGTLRELGTEGKLTAEIVFKAIQAAKGGIDELFAQTSPTIEQAFQVAETNFLEFLDRFDDFSGISTAVANAIIKLSENFDILMAAILSVGAGLAGLVTSKLLGGISAYIGKLKIAGGALARYRRIQATVAAGEAAQKAAIAATTAARVDSLSPLIRRSAIQVRSAQAEYAEAAAAFQNGRARDAQTGRFIANQAARDRLTAASIRLANAERANLGLTTKLAQARTAAIAADNAAAAAAGRAGAAQAARAGVLARLSATFPRLSGAVRVAAGAVAAFFGIIAANPIGALITAIALAGIAIFTFGDRIKVTQDGVVSLKDAAVAAFQLIWEWITATAKAISGTFKPALESVNGLFGTAFRSIVDIVVKAVYHVIDTITFIPRYTIGVVAGIVAAFQALGPGAGSAIDAVVRIFITGFEAVANIGINAVNRIIKAFNTLSGTKVGDLLGLSEIKEIGPADFSALQTSFGDGGQAAGEAFNNAFNKVFEENKAENVFKRFGTAIIDRARENIKNAQLTEGELTDSEINPSDPAGTGSKSGGGGGGQSADFASELAKLKERIELERQYGIQKEITNNILSIEQAIKRDLSKTEAEQVANATTLLEIAKIQGEVLESTLGPQEKLQLTQAALNDLFSQGAITLSQYNTKLRETQIAADSAANSLGGGFRAAIASSIQSAGEFGKTLGNFVVGAVDKASDAIVEFAKTGQFNIRQFFQDLFAQLLKLAAQRLLLQFIGGFLGIPGAGLAGFSQGGSILPSFAGGGSISPTGPGSTDSQVVAFNKRPDERVDILTPGQQAAQRNNANKSSGGSTTVNTQTNVAAVFSPDDIVNAFDGASGETVVVNMIQRNASTVRQIIQG